MSCDILESTLKQNTCIYLIIIDDLLIKWKELKEKRPRGNKGTSQNQTKKKYLISRVELVKHFIDLF